MNVITPITIRAAQLTSSSLTYPAVDETAWEDATGYFVGDTRSYTISGLIHKFECIQNHTSSTSNAPEAYPNENAYWTDLGAVNRYNMFQLERNTQSEGASPLTVSINPGERFGAVGIGRVEADSVQLQVFDGATELFNETKDLIDRSVASWWDYFYQPFRQIENTLFTDLPILSTATITLTFTRASGDVKVGFVVIGMPFNLGETEYKAKAESLNFSEIARDEFGEAKLTPRRDIPKTIQTVEIDKSNLNQVRAVLSELNATVALWFALSDPLLEYFDTLFIIGVYTKRSISVEGSNHALLDLELEQI